MKFVDLFSSFATIFVDQPIQMPGIIAILSIVIPAIAAVIASATFLTLLDRLSSMLQASKPKPVGLPEASTLKILQVKLEPLDEKEWKKTKNVYLILTIIVFITTSILLLILTFNPTIISLTFAFLSSLLFFYLYTKNKNLGKNPNSSRYLLSKEAKIMIEGDYDNIVILVQKTLKSMGMKSLEFDLNNKTFEAFVGSNLNHKAISIIIQNQEDKIHCMRLTSSTASDKRYERRSLIINHFIKLALLYLEVDGSSPSDQKRL